jgi:hypothetical protein
MFFPCRQVRNYSGFDENFASDFATTVSIIKAESEKQVAA